ncbi:MAG TPA: OmpA family protein [Polyangiaceae bacterium]|jgi:chemotaxis protein MotB
MRTLTLGLSVLFLVSGCVSVGKYDAAVADSRRAASELRAAQTRSTAELLAKDQELSALRRSMSEADERCAQIANDVESLKNSGVACALALDEATALNQQLRTELEKQGRNVDQLLSSKGALASSLDQAKARLEELRRAQAAAESRAALFRDVALRLRRMVDAGELQIVLRSGRMVLILPTDILFDSGKAKLGERGKEALSRVGAVLATIKNRRFQVAGHTDNDPIRFSGFASNWELSSERALQVVTFLVSAGMQPETLSVAGYGEFDPVSPNDSADGKAKNRRIEITLQPNIDELVAVPDKP